ncbi:hypothetical protein CH254_16835 [Rhodococcus sp. 06-412-2C]|uniref:hypothetical protein n=1 Tax=unclassified Rhodococcus (in: high G+C Gram-positive bacteria) TaxID=192944 RepID=UPI000B9A4CB2|nr:MULTISPECIES: hypothetical protein [unclassified Rhodococcus (in: high G+C Gram-positive bacteria)]OZC87315.1 hypothetical protein CH254_16835 [Rhodococcus sp. 06-412-2C]OZD00755.1 hypothetical protein CH279_07200 [Rhodococcus sp. 06-412-2B]
MTAHDDGYTPARILAEQFGIARIEIVRLAIGRKIIAFQGGRDWYVQPESLSAHLDALGPQ